MMMTDLEVKNHHKNHNKRKRRRSRKKNFKLNSRLNSQLQESRPSPLLSTADSHQVADPTSPLVEKPWRPNAL